MSAFRQSFRVARERNFALIAVALALVSNVSSAQHAVLEEVIVTAQKREQNMMDVPVALTAVSSRDLALYGVRDTAELTKISPSLSYGVSPASSEYTSLSG